MSTLAKELLREHAFLATCSLLFIASATGTSHLSRSPGMSVSGGMAMPGGWTMSMIWMRMPGQSWGMAAASFMAMWLVMMLAMMLPSFMQMLLSDLRRFRGRHGGRLSSLAAFAGAGYFFVWGVLGAAVYAVGVSLATAEVRWPMLARSVPGATGALLLLAGCIQLTAWKTRQLARCREPACAGSLPESARNAWEHGLRLGVRCALCCSSFMMVLLVVGVMNLRAMALITAAITVERFAPRPDRAARVAGAVVIAAGAIIVLRTLGIC
jgi:predicted metal-binding membrane protein